MNKKFVYILLCLLAGCTSSQQLKPMKLTFDEEDVTNEAVARTLDSLADSAQIAAEANLVLANLAKGDATLTMSEEEFNQYAINSTHTPFGMEREFDISYDGPAMPIIRMAAEISGYDVVEPDYRPIKLPTITIDTIKNPVTGGENLGKATVIDVLRMINASNKDRMDINIIEKLRLIEVSYK